MPHLKYKYSVVYKLFIFLIAAVLLPISHGKGMPCEEEYVVLFRGCHFTKKTKENPGYFVDLQNPENINSGQTVMSPHLSHSLGESKTHQRIMTFLNYLKESGPYVSPQTSKPYPSQYHWLQELYVNKYGQFLKDLQTPSSELGKLLHHHHIEFHENIFVSTTLDCKTAVKYALGICLKKSLRNWPESFKETGKHTSSPLGYVDIFFINRAALRGLGAFSVVEEFASDSMDVLHASLQRDYTQAAEYNFPLQILPIYHKFRFPISVQKTSTSPITDLKGFMSRKAQTIMNDITLKLECPLKKLKGHRVFLHRLCHRMDQGQKKLTPDLAKKVRKDVQNSTHEVASHLASKGISFYDTLTLPRALAFEHSLREGNEEYIFRCSHNTIQNINNIAALAYHNNLTRVIVGEERDSEEVFMSSLGMGALKFEIMPDITCLQEAALRRTKPLIFKMNLLLDRKQRNFFYNIEKETQRKIQFFFNRSMQEAGADADDAMDFDDFRDDEAYYWSLIGEQGYQLARILTKYKETSETLRKEAYETFMSSLKTRFAPLTPPLKRLIRLFQKKLEEKEDEWNYEEQFELDKVDTPQTVISLLREKMNATDNYSFIPQFDDIDEKVCSEFNPRHYFEEQEDPIFNTIAELFEHSMKTLKTKLEILINTLEKRCEILELAEGQDSDLEEHGFSTAESDLESSEEEEGENFLRKRKRLSSDDKMFSEDEFEDDTSEESSPEDTEDALF